VHGALHPITDADAELVAAWQRLAGRAAEPNPFFDPAMAVPAARHLPGGGDDRLLAVHDGTELAFALPVRQVARYRRLPLPAAVAWGHRHAFLGTPLLADQDATRAVGEALDTLRRQGIELLALERVRLDGPVWRALEAAAAADGLRLGAALRFERPIVLRRTEPSYLDGRLSASRRKRLRRARRALERELGAPLATPDVAGGDPGDALERFLTLERSGWKGRAGTAIDSDPADGRFFRAAMASFAARGRLRIWALGAGGVDVASMCAVEAGDGLFHLKIAHDEAYARFSPGMQLELDVVDAFHREQRSAWIDACTDDGPSPSELLYPDRAPMATLVVALGGARATAALAALRLGLDLRERLRSG
jgi:CelD/BcsL family acetyltransferase involved in cellulose biosynthesis